MGIPFEQPQRVTAAAIIKLAVVRGGRGWKLVWATCGLMLHQACEVAVPILIGVIVDQAVLTGDARALSMWLSVLGAVFVVLSLSYQRASLAMVRVYGNGEHELRQLVMGRVLHPRGGVDHLGTGEILSMGTSDTYRVAGVSWSIAQQGATTVAIVASAGAMAVISVPLALGVLAGTVAVMFGMQALARPLERLGMAEQASVAAASQVATDATEGLRIIHGIGAQEEMTRRYRQASAQSQTGSVVAGRALLAYAATSSAASVIFLGALTFAVAVMAADGAVTIGQLVTVIGLAQFLQGALAEVGSFGANWVHKRASARRLRSLLGLPFGFEAAGSGPISDAMEDPILRWQTAHHCGVTVNHGEMVGVRVGTVAAARDVARRLAFAVPVHAGELTVFGRDAVEVGPAAYRAMVVAPPHDGQIFTGSLRENVLFSAGVLDPHIMDVAALDDVVRLLGGPDVMVGESGRRLSGGQRQRVLLARALHSPGHVLVLDEPTTALDSVTEQHIAERLGRLSRTIIVVTSSPLLLTACDRVVDFDTELARP